MKPVLMIFTHIIIICLVTILAGCSTHTHDLSSEFAPLRNRGIQVLSTNNPYHGPNSLLAKAIEGSHTLTGYFRNNGIPSAIEVRGSNRNNEEVLLYYPASYQVFVARRIATSNESEEWLVDGPYGIGQMDYRLLRSHLERNQGLTPTLTVWGGKFSTENTIQVSSRNAMTFEPEVPVIYTPPPVTRRVVTTKPKVITADKKNDETIKSKVSTSTTLSKPTAVKAKIPALDDPKFNPVNADQRALLESQGYASRASNGDLLHPIEGGAQSLENIADWYMGSKNLVPELQEFNKIPETQLSAKKGVTLKIPLEFIKRTNKMPLNYRAPVEVAPVKENKDGVKEKPALNKVGAGEKNPEAAAPSEAKTTK